MRELDQKARSMRTIAKLLKCAQKCTYSHVCIIKNNNYLEKQQQITDASQTIFRLKMSYVRWYGALCAVLIEDFNDCRRVLRSQTDVEGIATKWRWDAFLLSAWQRSRVGAEGLFLRLV
jgi:hypothetical protein